MMNCGIDGEIHHFNNNSVAAVHYNDQNGIPMSLYVPSNGFKAGDKVKILILKK